MSVTENGTWTVVDNSDIGGPVYLQSSDFTHDAGLTVGGDFSSHEQLLEYAEEMARRLNALTTKSEKLAGLVDAAESLLSYAEEYAAGNDFTEERAAIAAAKGGV